MNFRSLFPHGSERQARGLALSFRRPPESVVGWLSFFFSVLFALVLFMLQPLRDFLVPSFSSWNSMKSELAIVMFLGGQNSRQSRAPLPQAGCGRPPWKSSAVLWECVLCPPQNQNQQICCFLSQWQARMKGSNIWLFLCLLMLHLILWETQEKYFCLSPPLPRPLRT